jgi:integrase
MASLEKHGRYWSIYWREPGGRARRLAVNKVAGRKILRKGEAEDVLARWTAEHGTRFAPMVPGFLGDLLDRYRRHAEQRFTPDTFRSEMTRINEFVSWCTDRGIARADQVSALTIEDFKAARIELAGPTTTNRYLERVRAFFNQAIVWRFVTANPFDGVKMLKTHQVEPRFLTDDEIVRLLDVTSGDLHDGIMIALQTGCRETELVRIEWGDVRDDGIHFRKTKSYKPRTVPYAPGVPEMIDRRRLARTPKVRFLFDTGSGGELWNSGQWYSRLRFAYARAQIDGANFHSLRHTFATRLVRADVNLKVVQTLMGHADVATTMRYVHLYQGDAQRAVSRLVLPNSLVTAA